MAPFPLPLFPPPLSPSPLSPPSPQLKALAPDVPTVTLPPSTAPSDPAGPPTSAAPPPRLVPLLLHLTELDLTGSGSRSYSFVLAIEKLQAAAPNLRALKFDATGPTVQGGLLLGPEPAEPGPGFPQLRVCELGLSRAKGLLGGGSDLRRRGATLDTLRRVVGRSSLLRSLDVSGSMSVPDEEALRSAASLAGAFNPRTGLAGSGSSAAAAAAAVAELPADEAAALAAAASAAAAAAEAALALATSAAGPPPSGSGYVAAKLHVSLASCWQGAGGQLPPLHPGCGLVVLRASRSLLASDAGLAALAAVCGGTLQVLDVSESSAVTDAGLLHVAASCTALTSLDASSTGITDWGVKALLASPLGRGGGAGGPAGGPGRGPGGALVDLTREDEDEGGGAAGGGGLVVLDISSCRGVDRATRHAAAEGLPQLRRRLGL
ncbi:hypothetical protein HYH03_010703 [Edaphochlamys debaryana]|uniref:Uncharacterized protein n=1 Tax=Edaphochlamys debaryana TaxID=47281 RepID=A0A836BVU4_9CHLO|nr:hypothetical protein HYH03_010703 [Edaphochlamys debaryana]|eukprot:KAG2490780.1 hypothetical protein HYH03_010703 [Edaphochlamys debaryana]